MQVALIGEGKRVKAWQIDKRDAPFICPACREVVIVKKGEIREHHFAHRPGADCDLSHGETESHMKVKRILYTELSKHPLVSRCEIERQFDGVRSDVSCYIGDIPVALEIQCSPISKADIEQRMLRYAEQDMSVVWIVDGIPQRTKRIPGKVYSRYRPKAFQQYLYGVMLDRLYVWMQDITVRVIHFVQHGDIILPRGGMVNLVTDFHRFIPAHELQRNLWMDKLIQGEV